jgi:hypothetical protein
MWRWCGDEPATDLLAWRESPGLYEVVHDDEHEQLELGPERVRSAAPLPKCDFKTATSVAGVLRLPVCPTKSCASRMALARQRSQQ